MTPAVTSARFPYLPVNVKIGPVISSPLYEVNLEPMVDTGFDGGLAVPVGVIPDTMLPSGQMPWTLADGSDIYTPFYVGYVTVGHLRPVPTVIIVFSGDHLLGRHVTDDFRVTFEYGQRIIVEA
jgi:predicted aspartyl protease